MLALYTQIGPWSIPTFRLTVGIAIVLSLLVGLYRQRSRGRLVDLYLGALVLGIIGARLIHVALNWDYFTDNQAEIWVIGAGGLNWHGAVLGGLLGLALMRWLHPHLNRLLVKRLSLSHVMVQKTTFLVGKGLRPFRSSLISSKLSSHEPAMAVGGLSLPQGSQRGLGGEDFNSPSFNHLLTSLIPALPLIGLGGWVGCLAAGCGYGREVDSLANYPRWMTSELVDVFGIVAPRFNTPYFGIALSLLGLLIMAIALFWRRRPSASPIIGQQFWWLLAFMSAGMFIIGFYRADHTFVIYGLRADQLLDVMMGIWSLVLAIRLRGHQRTANP